MDEKISAMLREVAPGTQWKVESKQISGGTMETIELPRPPEADYFFSLHLYPDGEKGISANLPDSNREIYFWFKTFELPDYKNEVDRLDHDFLKTVETLLTRETMILQKKGLLWHTFRLAYRVGEEGRVLSSHAGFRLGFAAPRIQGREHTYRSGPLGKDHSMDPAPTIQRRGSHISLFRG
jgi:hypothetical protein